MRAPSPIEQRGERAEIRNGRRGRRSKNGGKRRETKSSSGYDQVRVACSVPRKGPPHVETRTYTNPRNESISLAYFVVIVFVSVIEKSWNDRSRGGHREKNDGSLDTATCSGQAFRAKHLTAIIVIGSFRTMQF